MASTLYETLNAIEYGRQNCIKNAKLANLPATDNMTVYDLGELFLQQNNTEQVDKVWTRPSDWWDTKTILENAEERDGLFPAYILLLNDDAPTTTFTKTATGKQLQFDGILTSDGSWYTEDNSIHTWDTTQDKECADGYKTRYIIVYFASKTTKKLINLENFNCIEIVLGYCTIQLSNLNKCIQNLETLETDTITLTSSTFRSNNTLKSVTLSSLTNITLTENNSIYLFADCVALETVFLPSLTSISSTANNSNLYIFYNCNSLKSVYLPNLTTISSKQSILMFYNCTALKSVFVPLLANL